MKNPYSKGQSKRYKSNNNRSLYTNKKSYYDNDRKKPYSKDKDDIVLYY